MFSAGPLIIVTKVPTCSLYEWNIGLFYCITCSWKVRAHSTDELCFALFIEMSGWDSLKWKDETSLHSKNQFDRTRIERNPESDLVKNFFTLGYPLLLLLFLFVDILFEMKMFNIHSFIHSSESLTNWCSLTFINRTKSWIKTIIPSFLMLSNNSACRTLLISYWPRAPLKAAHLKKTFF